MDALIVRIFAMDALLVHVHQQTKPLRDFGVWKKSLRDFRLFCKFLAGHGWKSHHFLAKILRVKLGKNAVLKRRRK